MDWSSDAQLVWEALQKKYEVRYNNFISSISAFEDISEEHDIFYSVERSKKYNSESMMRKAQLGQDLELCRISSEENYKSTKNIVKSKSKISAQTFNMNKLSAACFDENRSLSAALVLEKETKLKNSQDMNHLDVSMNKQYFSSGILLIENSQNNLSTFCASSNVRYNNVSCFSLIPESLFSFSEVTALENNVPKITSTSFPPASFEKEPFLSVLDLGRIDKNMVKISSQDEITANNQVRINDADEKSIDSPNNYNNRDQWFNHARNDVTYNLTNEKFSENQFNEDSKESKLFSEEAFHSVLCKSLDNPRSVQSCSISTNSACPTYQFLPNNGNILMEENLTLLTSSLPVGSDNDSNNKLPGKKRPFVAPFKKIDSSQSKTSRGNSDKFFKVPKFKKKHEKFLVQNATNATELLKTFCQNNSLKKIDNDVYTETALGEMLKASSVAMTLIYSNDSSQLRNIADQQAVGLGFGYNTETTLSQSYTSLSVVQLSFDLDKSKKGLVKKIFETLLADRNVKKICFGFQEFTSNCIKHGLVDPSHVICNWVNIHDPKIATWLLHPEESAFSFHQCLGWMRIVSSSNSINQDSSHILSSDLYDLILVTTALDSHLREQNLFDLYCNIEMPISTLLAVMETRGIQVVLDTMIISCNFILRKLNQLETKAHALVGKEFSLNSHQQLRDILYEQLELDKKIPSLKMLKTFVGKQKSTSESILKQLVPIHQLPAVVLEYRQLQKLKTTFFDGLRPFISNGLLHTHWIQTAAATGRIVSSSPNMQAVPRDVVVLKQIPHQFIKGKDEEPVEISPRSVFISHTGFILLSADFQQIEFRLIAHLSADEKLITMLQVDTVDIFISLAAKLLSKPVEQVVSTDRELIKRTIYSVIYGIGPDRLAEYLETSSKEAQAVAETFLSMFPGVNKYIKDTVNRARHQGYLTTLCKRRRWFPNINHSNRMLRCQAERQAINFSVQGSAADICKSAMLRIEQLFHSQPQLQARLLLQIHDELLFEIAYGKIAETGALIKSIMESPTDELGNRLALSVPLHVVLQNGNSWASLTPLNIA